MYAEKAIAELTSHTVSGNSAKQIGGGLLFSAFGFTLDCISFESDHCKETNLLGVLVKARRIKTFFMTCY